MADNEDTEGAKGKVHLFNTTNQRIRVTLNGNPLEKLYGHDPQTFFPSTLAVPRSDATSIDDPVFAQQNDMQVMFSGTSDKYSAVSISPTTSPTDKDLALYIFYGQVVLLDLSSNVATAIPADKTK